MKRREQIMDLARFVSARTGKRVAENQVQELMGPLDVWVRKYGQPVDKLRTPAGQTVSVWKRVDLDGITPDEVYAIEDAADNILAVPVEKDKPRDDRSDPRDRPTPD